MDGDTPVSASRYVIVGRVRKPHGVRGDLVVEPVTSDPGAVLAPGRRVFGGTRTGDTTPDMKELHVNYASAFQGVLIMHFAEIGDYETAELWRDRFLLLPQEELAPPGGDEIYLHDLIGLSVQSSSGEPLGSVIAFYELRQGLMLEIERDGGTYMLPYRDEFIDHIDRERRTLVVALPEGFFH